MRRLQRACASRRQPPSVPPPIPDVVLASTLISTRPKKRPQIAAAVVRPAADTVTPYHVAEHTFRPEVHIAAWRVAHGDFSGAPRPSWWSPGRHPSLSEWCAYMGVDAARQVLGRQRPSSECHVPPATAQWGASESPPTSPLPQTHAHARAHQSAAPVPCWMLQLLRCSMKMCKSTSAVPAPEQAHSSRVVSATVAGEDGGGGIVPRPVPDPVPNPARPLIVPPPSPTLSLPRSCNPPARLSTTPFVRTVPYALAAFPPVSTVDVGAFFNRAGL